MYHKKQKVQVIKVQSVSTLLAVVWWTELDQMDIVVEIITQLLSAY